MCLIDSSIDHSRATELIISVQSLTSMGIFGACTTSVSGSPIDISGTNDTDLFGMYEIV